jgi:hypothetical protein
MRPFDAGKFYNAVAIMRRAQGLMDGRDDTKEMPKSTRSDACKIFVELKSVCGDLGLRVTELAVADVIRMLRRRTKTRVI